MSDMSTGWRRTAGAAVLIVVVMVGALLTAASAQAAPSFTGTFTTAPATFRAGDMGDSVNLTLRNAGPDPVLAADEVTVVVNVPSGVTVRTLTASGWNCTLVTRACTRSAAMNVNASAAFTARMAIDRSVSGDITVSYDVSGGGASSVTFEQTVTVEPYRPFGVHDFVAGAYDVNGDPLAQAGAHPDKASASFEFNANTTLVGNSTPVEDVRRLITELPAGFIGNPQVVTECPESVMVAEQCPPEAFVGRAIVRIGGQAVGAPTGVYNIKPGPGHAAQFGFAIVGIGVTFMYAEVRTDDDYGVTITVPTTPAGPKIDSVSVELFGNPADPRYDSVRCPRMEYCFGDKPSSNPPKPFLTMQASECSPEEPVTRLSIDSWENKGRFVSFEAASPAVTGCEKLTFEPEVDITPTTTLADSPTGLNVDMRFPQEDNAEGLAPPALKKTVVTLPEGMTINPSGAEGLGACADGELQLKSKAPVRCSEASKIGTVTAKSPLLKETLTGGVYLRSQNSIDPESGEMFRLALVLENEERGLSFRLPGQIRVNQDSGRLVTTFDNNPELPVESVNLRFKDGPRAPLTTPSTCGTHSIDTVLTSWGKQTETLQSTFKVDCAEGAGSFTPGFQAGTSSPIAGQNSPFVLKVVRPDGDRELKSIRSIKLPEGLLGDVSSVPLCGEAQAAVGACPPESRVGHVQVAAGAGPNPLWVPQQGKAPTSVSLTGPHNGAPYGLSIMVPAQAGPFDLGRVVVRSALHVDERTAAITSGVDETRLIDSDGSVTQILPADLPRILKGVVLNQREIRVIVDREGFMVNPTDCSQQQISAEIHAYGGGKAEASNRFRAVECASLGFAPRLGAKILNKGRKSTLRSFHPRTRFTVVPRKGDANIGGARVALPSSTILDQSNIGTTCTRAQMAERACPAKSLVGYAKAWSPLLRKAVEGPVYLAANGGVRPLPDLAAVLDGEIRVVLQGEISTLRSGGKARLQNTFRVVPDAPVSRFVLTMRGGKNTGLLVNSTDLCRTNERGVAVFTGQNGKRHRLGLRLTPSFKGCAKVRRQAARQKGAA